MVYITGDMHGDFRRFGEKSMKKLTKQDVLLVCGDFGFVWTGSEEEQNILKKLSKKKYTIALVNGVHDNLTLLRTYPETTWCGGRVHQIAPNIFHLISGELFEIQGKHLLAIGGGYDLQEESLDIHIDMPSTDDILEISARVQNYPHSLDMVLTHQAPSNIDACITHTSCDTTLLTDLLDKIQETATFGTWYFGSYHKNKVISSLYQSVYDQVIGIGTAEKKFFGKIKK